MSKMSLAPVTEYQRKIAGIFAEYCVYTNEEEYANRHQNDSGKLVIDIYNGKLAEYHVFNTLMERRKNPTPPDIMIYEKDKKSFDADITCGLIKVHVKSCREDSPFANSWLFQPNDSLVEHPTDTDYLALCVLGEDPYMYLVKASDMYYNAPAKTNLDKKVIYEDFVKTYLAIQKMKA